MPGMHALDHLVGSGLSGRTYCWALAQIVSPQNPGRVMEASVMSAWRWRTQLIEVGVFDANGELAHPRPNLKALSGSRRSAARLAVEQGRQLGPVNTAIAHRLLHAGYSHTGTIADIVRAACAPRSTVQLALSELDEAGVLSLLVVKEPKVKAKRYTVSFPAEPEEMLVFAPEPAQAHTRPLAQLLTERFGRADSDQVHATVTRWHRDFDHDLITAAMETAVGQHRARRMTADSPGGVFAFVTTVMQNKERDLKRAQREQAAELLRAELKSRLLACKEALLDEDPKRAAESLRSLRADLGDYAQLFDGDRQRADLCVLWAFDNGVSELRPYAELEKRRNYLASCGLQAPQWDYKRMRGED